MPPSVITTSKSEYRRLEHHRQVLGSSLKSLESNRKELSQPWDVNRANVEERRTRKKIMKQLDPPEMNVKRDDKTKKSVKVVNFRRDSAATFKPDPIAKPTTKKVAGSRVHPAKDAPASEEKSKATRRVSSKAKDPNGIYHRIQSDSQKIFKEATKKLSSSRRGLYEEFPRRPSSKTDDLNQSSISCSSINKDEHGLFVEEVDWKNTSIDWGDEYDYEVDDTPSPKQELSASAPEFRMLRRLKDKPNPLMRKK